MLTQSAPSQGFSPSEPHGVLLLSSRHGVAHSGHEGIFSLSCSQTIFIVKCNINILYTPGSSQSRRSTGCRLISVTALVCLYYLTQSHSASVSTGVPQGSFLRPLLLLTL